MKEDLFTHLSETASDPDLPDGHRQRFSLKLDEHFHLENRLWNLQRYFMVASVIVFLGISLLVLISIGTFQSSKTVFAGTSSEMYETEMFFRAEIDSRLSQLSENENIDKQLIADILEMDGSLKQIQADLELNPGDDRLVSAVFESYQAKLELLDRIISQFEYYEN